MIPRLIILIAIIVLNTGCIQISEKVSFEIVNGKSSVVNEHLTENYMMIMLGALFAMGLYNIAIFLWRRKDRTYLYLGLLSILMSFRTLVSADLYISDILKGQTTDFYNRVDLFSYFITVPLFVNYIRKLYSNITNKRIVVYSNIFAVVSIAALLIIKSKDFVTLLLIYNANTIILSIYLIYVIGLAVYNKIEGSKLSLIGVIFLIATVIFDMAVGTGMIRGLEISYIGMFGFMLTQSILLGNKISGYVLTSERLEVTEKLREINEDLTKTLNLEDVIEVIKKILSQYIENTEIKVYLKKENFFERYEHEIEFEDEEITEKFYIDDSKDNFIGKAIASKDIFIEKDGENKAKIHVPIIYRNELTAVFSFSCIARENMIENPELIIAIVEQAGIAIENAMLYTYLGNNIDKIKTIEELSGIVYREKDKMKAIQYILLLIVSRIGLGFKRVLYFEYDRTNKVLVSNSKYYTCHNFMNITGNEGVKEYELSIKSNTFIAKTFNEGLPIFSTEYENPDDLFIKSYKIENFITVPVIYENNKYGVVLIEAKDKGVVYESERDINILKIFIQNLAIYLENKELEEEGLKTKKLETMIILANSIVHEVKTPLSGIKGYAGIVNKKYGQDEKIAEYMLKIIRESERIDEMATQLLEYAGAKEEVFSMEVIPIYIIIDKALKKKKKDFEAHNIKVTMQVDERVQIKADMIKLGIAFSAIIKNAIEASKGENDELVIVSREIRDEYEICITDKGVGIEADVLDNIFEPLVTTKMQGTGLGMPVALNIIKKHGGSIKVESIRGKGTTVKIILPHY